MNWIAHIFLSEQNTYFQIANYLADPLKGKPWSNANENIKRGMFVHKQIDSFTDKHELFKKSKNRLGDSGLLKAVVIDLTYDYLLTKNWDKFSNIQMDIFLNQFYNNTLTLFDKLPEQPRFYLERLIKHDILNKYQTLDDLKKAFLKVDSKLSSRLLKRDNVSRYFEMVSLHIEQLEEDFLEFFPELCNETKKYLDKDLISHWKL